MVVPIFGAAIFFSSVERQDIFDGPASGPVQRHALDHGAQEGLALEQGAVLQHSAHVRGIAADIRFAEGQLLGRLLKLQADAQGLQGFDLRAQVLHARSQVVHIEAPRLQGRVELVQAAVEHGDLRIFLQELIANLIAVPADLRVDKAHKLRQVLVGQHPLLELADDGLLQALPADELGMARRQAAPDSVVADVVEEARAFRRASRHMRPAPAAVEHPAEQVLAVERARMDMLVAARRDDPLRLLERLAVDDGPMRLLDPDRLIRRTLDRRHRILVHAVEDENARRRLVAQDVVDAVDLPPPAPARPQAFRVKNPRDLLRAPILQAQPEHPPHDRSLDLVRRELVLVVVADLHPDFLEAVGRDAAVEKSPLSVLLHAPDGVMGEVR